MTKCYEHEECEYNTQPNCALPDGMQCPHEGGRTTVKCRNCKHLGFAEEYPGNQFFGWCDETNDSPDMDMKRECRYFKQATNADIIRRMNDEQLAKFLCEFRSCDYELHHCNNCKGEPYYRAGHNGMIDWLQKPAGEDTDEH